MPTAASIYRDGHETRYFRLDDGHVEKDAPRLRRCAQDSAAFENYTLRREYAAEAARWATITLDIAAGGLPPMSESTQSSEKGRCRRARRAHLAAERDDATKRPHGARDARTARRLIVTPRR